MNGVVERLVGSPVAYDELKHKPGRRLTLRGRGPRGNVIVKLYLSDRVGIVAERLTALAGGPPEPELPRVLAVDVDAHLLVLSDVSGVPLRHAVLRSDLAGCRRAGAAIAGWHSAWAGARPAALTEHTVERELEILSDRSASADGEIGRGIEAAVPELRESWQAETVVHRDLYDEQVLLGERVALVDLDDAAVGPAELDVGNLVAHLDLLELRSGRAFTAAKRALLDGYATRRRLDVRLLERCRTLARLRLACIHTERRLLETVDSPAATGV